MDPLTIAMTLSQFAPQLVKWITGSDKAEAAAAKAVDIAKQVTGTASGDDAVKALQANPDLVLKYRQAVLDQEVEFEKLAVENAADVNKTMQTEDSSEHWATYTWRPFIGFAVGTNVFASGVLVLLAYGPAFIGQPLNPAAISNLPMVLAALAGINTTVLPILGIASWFRGKMQATNAANS